MKVFRNISSFILSLILAFVIVFLQVSLFINTKILNTDFYISKFQKHGLYEYLYESVYNNFGQVSRKVNLPLVLFDDIITKDWIKAQTDNSTKETVDYIMYKTDKLSVLDVGPQSDKFNINLDNYLKSLNLKIDKKTEKEIKDIKGQVGTIIKSQVKLIDITSISKNSTFQKIRKALFYVYSSRLLIFGIILINMFLILLAVDRGFSNFTAWIGYSLIAGGFFTFVPSIIAYLSGFMSNIAITEGILKQLAVAFVKDSLKYFSIFGAIILFIGVILTFSTALYQYRKYNDLNL